MTTFVWDVMKERKQKRKYYLVQILVIMMKRRCQSVLIGSGRQMFTLEKVLAKRLKVRENLMEEMP